MKRAKRDGKKEEKEKKATRFEAELVLVPLSLESKPCPQAWNNTR